MSLSSADLTRRLARGVLAFPATAFADDGSLDAARTQAHVADLAAQRPCALVPAGGAGEVFSLNGAEHEALVALTVGVAAGIPVVAGVGGGLAAARDMARAAQRAGADAVLLLPPYLVTPEQDGLAEQVRMVCQAIDIPVIVYSRDNGIFAAATVLRLAETCPNLIGLKDGTGDFETILEVRLKAADRLVLINGVPTAEILAAQCFAVGVTAYSSAVFGFWPEMALAFYAAVERGDAATRDRLLQGFYLPLCAIRRRKRGYAVAIIKAGLDIMGRSLGRVRAPLVDLAPDDRRELAALIDKARPLVAAAPGQGRA